MRFLEYGDCVNVMDLFYYRNIKGNTYYAYNKKKYLYLLLCDSEKTDRLFSETNNKIVNSK